MISRLHSSNAAFARSTTALNLKGKRMRLVLLNCLVMVMLITPFTPLNPLKVAQAFDPQWSGITSTPQRVKDVVVRVSPKNGKVYIIGHHERGDLVDGKDGSGIFMYTSDSNFQVVRRIASPDNDKVEKVRATFDLDGNLHIVWHERPGDFTAYYLKMDQNENFSSVVNLNPKLSGGARQHYHVDIQSSLLPGSDKKLYLADQEKVSGGEDIGIGIYESSDGGNTWTNYYLPPPTGVGQEANGAEPRITVGPNGEVHVGFSRAVLGMWIASKVPSKANQDGFNSQGWKVFQLESPTTPVYYRSMAVNPNGKAFAVWASFQGLPNKGAPALATWDPIGKSWSSPRFNFLGEDGSSYSRLYDVSLVSGANSQVLLNYAVDTGTCGDLTYTSILKTATSDNQGDNWNAPFQPFGNTKFDHCPPKRMDTYFDGKNGIHSAGEFDFQVRYIKGVGGGSYVVAPKTNVRALPATILDTNNEFELQLDCTEGCNQGAPVIYEVYQRDITAGGQFTKFIRTTSNTVTFFDEVPGHIHQFYSRGTVSDKTEDPPPNETPDAQTQIVGPATDADISYFSVSDPKRIFDTRPNSGVPGAGQTLPAGGTINVPIVADNSPVPQGAVSAIMNVTVSETTAPGFLVVYPADKSNPATSSVNWSRTGAQVGNLVIVGLSPDGKVKVSASASSAANFTVDILGYTSANTQNALYYKTLPTPLRIYNNATSGEAKLSGPNKEKRTIQVAGTNGIPANAKAIFANLTAGQTTGGGFTVLYPSDAIKPSTTSVNYSASGAISLANFTLVKLSADGKLTMEADGAGSANIYIDVVAYLDDDRAGGVLDVNSPERIYDSRDTSAGGNKDGTVATSSGATTRTVTVGGGTEKTAKAVLVNTTATDVYSGGFLALFPGSTNWPGTSTVSYSLDRSLLAIRTFSNFAIVGVDSGQNINVLAGGTPSNLILDIVGFIVPNPSVN